MLERAVACLEPTPQLFSRLIEPPFHSLRALGPSFWHNGGDQLAVPPWWPMYLAKVRDSSVTFTPNEKTSRTSKLIKTPKSAPVVQQFHSKHTERKSIQTLHHDQRPYTQSTLRQQLPVEKDSVISDSPEHVEAVDKFWGKRLAKASVADLLQRYSGRSDLPEQEKVWVSFVTLEDEEQQHRYASSVLDHLAKSSDRLYLERALQTFALLKPGSRSKKDYINAVDVALRRRNISFALTTCQEACFYDRGRTTRQMLLAACLSQGLWKSAAKAWSSLFVKSDDPALTGFEEDQALSWLEGKYHLPIWISHLCSRLLDENTMLSANTDTLRTLAHSLFLLILRSQAIMNRASMSLIIQLFRQQHQLGCLRGANFEKAMQALLSAEGQRTRADLALKVYRTWRIEQPAAIISMELFHRFIAFCDKANSPSDVFDYWLSEIKSMHGAADEQAFDALMWGFARSGEVDRVKQLLDQMIAQHGRLTNAKQFTPVLRAHAVKGNVSRTLAAMKDLQKTYDLRPQAASWNEVFLAYARSNKPRSVFELFNRLDKKTLWPNATTFETLLGICSKFGDINTALSLVERAKSSGTPVSANAIAGLVNVYCEADQPEAAERLAEATASMKLNKPTTKIWDNLLRYYAFHSNFPAIRRIQNTMRRLSIKASDMTFATILNSLVYVEKTSDALRLLRYLDSVGHVGDASFHFAIILHGFAMEKNSAMVEAIHREMQDRFPSESPSTRLSMLYYKAHNSRSLGLHEQMGSSAERRYFRAQQMISFVNENASQTSSADRFTSAPQPGFQRQPAFKAVDTVYSNFGVEYLASHGNPIAAQHMADVYRSKQADDVMTANDNTIETLQMRLSLALRLFKVKEADSLWCQILWIGIQENATSPLPSSLKPPSDSEDPRSTMEELRTGLQSQDSTIFLNKKFILSSPLRRYMQTLAQQRRYDDLIYLVKEMYSLTFALTSSDWNMYIQILCQSDQVHYQLLAFNVCEKLKFRNSWIWKTLLQTPWVKGQQLKDNGYPNMRRSRIEIMPTYRTFMCLGMVLFQFRRQAIRGDATNLKKLTAEYAGYSMQRLLGRLPLLRKANIKQLLLGRKGTKPSVDDLAAARLNSIFEEVEKDVGFAEASEGAVHQISRIGEAVGKAIFSENENRATPVPKNPDHRPVDQTPSVLKRVDKERQDVISSATGNLSTQPVLREPPTIKGKSVAPPSTNINPSDFDKQLQALRQRKREMAYVPPVRLSSVMRKWELFTRGSIERQARIRVPRRRRRRSIYEVRQPAFLTRKAIESAPMRQAILRGLDDWLWPLLSKEEIRLVESERQELPLPAESGSQDAPRKPGGPVPKYSRYSARDKVIDQLLPTRRPLLGYEPRDGKYRHGPIRDEKKPQVRRHPARTAVGDSSPKQPQTDLFGDTNTPHRAGKGNSPSRTDRGQGVPHQREREPESKVTETITNLWEWKEGSEGFKF